MATAKTYRTEKDSMGSMQVPEDAYYAAQTQRAVENFPISDLRLPRSMLAALGLIKGSAAAVNLERGLLEKDFAEAIQKAAAEVASGELDDHFVVDIFQTGSGTSSNMNSNEVIANRASEILDGEKKIHPNDHVNMGQSSNDVFPTAMHVALAARVSEHLLPKLEVLKKSLAAKEKEFSKLVKTGRTHLQDATPMTLGQEFSGYRSQIEHGIARLETAMEGLLELPLGGTAVGTGLNTPEGFAADVIAKIAAAKSLSFREADNHFEAQAAKDAVVALSGQLKTLACSMAKIANDLRWLGSGPRCGLGELRLPEVQPGSSIMPGKVNPVIAESVLMVSAQVIGNDATISLSGYTGGVLELNVMMPVMAYAALQSVEILGSSAENFAEKCIDGIEANEQRLEELAEASIAICTALAPKIGYDRAAELAKEAFKSGKPLRQVARESGALGEQELDEALDLMSMTRPGL